MGGIQGKVLAAHRAGIRELILPARNRKDLEEVDDQVRSEMTFHFVEQSFDAIRVAVPAWETG